MITQDQIAAVRRVLMYWGNIGKAKQRSYRRLAEIEQEIEGIYDLQPQQLTGMPHGSQISDSTSRKAAKAICITAGLNAEKERLQQDIAALERDFDMIRYEVMCLPPLQSDIITMRYCDYGYAKREYWAKIATRAHTTVDNAKRAEHKGVVALARRIKIAPDAKEATQGHG